MFIEYIAGIVLMIAFIFTWKSDHLPDVYRARKCKGKQWLESFPGSSKDEIRAFLNTFVDAFAFSGNDKLKFSPSDKILGIYRELYPSKWSGDAYEMESLFENIFNEYHINMNNLWHEELTLGELYSHVYKT